MISEKNTSNWRLTHVPIHFLFTIVVNVMFLNKALFVKGNHCNSASKLAVSLRSPTSLKNAIILQKKYVNAFHFSIILDGTHTVRKAESCCSLWNLRRCLFLRWENVKYNRDLNTACNTLFVWLLKMKRTLFFQLRIQKKYINYCKKEVRILPW